MSGLGYKNDTSDSPAPVTRADKGSANFVQSELKENAVRNDKDGLVTMDQGGDICLVTVKQSQNEIKSGYVANTILRRT